MDDLLLNTLFIYCVASCAFLIVSPFKKVSMVHAFFHEVKLFLLSSEHVKILDNLVLHYVMISFFKGRYSLITLYTFLFYFFFPITGIYLLFVHSKDLSFCMGQANELCKWMKENPESFNCQKNDLPKHLQSGYELFDLYRVSVIAYVKKEL